MPHSAKKSFGQHFLRDSRIVEDIVTAADITEGETVLEIGPGTGVLTRALLDAGANVVAVEADRGLIDALDTTFGDDLSLLRGNAVDPALFERLAERFSDHAFNNFQYKLVANLPYNIASHVLRRFLNTPPKPSRMVVMLQKEVAQRVVAAPPDMSVLSVACQLYADCRIVRHVPPGAFRPPPKVESAVVRLDVKHRPTQDCDPEKVISLAKTGFSSRRKQLKTNLANAGIATRDQTAAYLKASGMAPTVRAQNLTVEQWVALAKRFRLC